MNVNDLRSLVTVLSLASFIGIVAWVFAPRRKAHFDEFAALALSDDAAPTARAHADLSNDLSEEARRPGAV
jgi:cytochrome c oxidase cbb3-type subunit IV